MVANCSGEGLHPPGAPPYLAIPAIFSSTLSCISSLIIVFSFWRWKDIRTGSRAIVSFLSIADFFTAFGYILGSLNYAFNFNRKESNLFQNTCQIQSFITSSSSLSSFLWTSTLALYLFLTLVLQKCAFAHRLFPLFHVVNWSLPLLVCLPLLATGQLGYSHYAVSTWCFIGEKEHKSEEALLVLVAGKLWEMLTYLVVIVFYVVIKRHISKQAQLGYSGQFLSSELVAVLRKSDKKLVAIPILFVLLRMWGTVQYFYSLGAYTQEGCTTTPWYVGFMLLSFLQAIGDGGQGWGNFILYVIVSDKVRSRLLTCCALERATPPQNHHIQNGGGAKILLEHSTNSINCQPNPKAKKTTETHQNEVDTYEATTT